MELFYKGYRTNVKFDAEDKYFYGKLEGIRDLVNFGTDFEDKIVEEFHSAVDDYLEYCKEIGKEPNREDKVTFKVSVDFDFYKFLNDAAKNAGVTFDSYILKKLA